MSNELFRNCARCGTLLPYDAFPLRTKASGKRHTHCRDCKAAYQRQWYRRNRERHMADVAAIRRALRAHNQALVRAAKSQPCADCHGRFPPCAMDFDHVRGRKLGNIAHLKNYAPTAVLIAEMEKCEVVCANCHRIRSAARDQRGQETHDDG